MLALRARDLLATRLNWRPSNLEVAIGQLEDNWETGPRIYPPPSVTPPA
jgi:hypothetical protein